MWCERSEAEPTQERLFLITTNIGQPTSQHNGGEPTTNSLRRISRSITHLTLYCHVRKITGRLRCCCWLGLVSVVNNRRVCEPTLQHRCYLLPMCRRLIFLNFSSEDFCLRWSVGGCRYGGLRGLFTRLGNVLVFMMFLCGPPISTTLSHQS